MDRVPARRLSLQSVDRQERREGLLEVVEGYLLHDPHHEKADDHQCPGGDGVDIVVTPGRCETEKEGVLPAVGDGVSPADHGRHRSRATGQTG